MTQGDFSRQTTKVGDVHVVLLRGELDMESSEGLADWLVDISGSSVVVDLSEVTFMDSSGIAALVMAKNRITANGDELVLTRPHQFVERTLRIVGLADLVSDWDPRWDAG